MKSLFVPTAIIISLIVFFQIIHNSVFIFCNDVQSVHYGDKTKRESSLSSTYEPVTKKLHVETGRPIVAVTDMITETKSNETISFAESNPVTDKSSGIISFAEIKLENKPVAIPVLTPEDAMKSNEEAIQFQRNIVTAKAAEEKLSKTKETQLLVAKNAPVAIPVLTSDEAIKANEEAIWFQRKAKAFQKIGLNTNRIHFIIALLPLLFIADLLLIKRKNKETRNKPNEYMSISRRVRILFPVSLLAFGVLVFVPWSVYFGNSLQFPFIFQDFVNWNLRVLTISIIAACIILLLIPPIISDYIVAMIAGLGLCVYVQAMFMNQYLGTMNGTEPEWSEHRIFGLINMAVWIIIVLSPVVLKKMKPSLFSKTISMVTGIILFLEIVATVSMVLSANQNVWVRTDTYFADGSKQFQFSKEKNVVVFIFDTLGSEFTRQCFDRYPETKKVVKDFIWYPDARSNYGGTFPGVPHELTGAYLSAPVNSFNEFFDKLWNSASAKSFYNQMENAGYEARLYCTEPTFIIGPQEYFQSYFSNIEAKNIIYQINKDRLHFCLKQMSGFSLSPFFLKKKFFYAVDFSDDVVQLQVDDISPEKKWIPQDNFGLLKKMLSSGISTDANKSILSIYYSRGVHKEWYLDEKCNKKETPFDTPFPTTGSCFFVLSEFIRLLKEADVYDNTAILICSDHGGNDRKYSTPFDMTFMVKQFNENKTDLSIDDSKVQSIDILPTLLKMACGERALLNDFDGFSSFSVPNNRNRLVYRLAHSDDYSEPDPDLARCYPGINCIEEYRFIDTNSFQYGTDSKSFIRQMPLVAPLQEDQ